MSQGSVGEPIFDRIRPPKDSLPAVGEAVVETRDGDVQGKRALFSGADQPPAFGSVALDCGNCSRRSVVSYVRLARMMTTGFYVPVVTQRAWIKCPACKEHAWVTVRRS